MKTPRSRTELAIGRLDEVLESSLPMVKRIAHKVAANFGTPTGMDVDDLVSHGVLGLAEAYDRFDPDRGVQFEAFASMRVRGAIVDAIRHVDWVPRKVRTHVRLVNEAQAELTSKLGRAPTPAELGERLGTKANAKRKAPATLVALEASPGGHDEGRTILDTIIAGESDQPGWELEQRELRAELPVAMDELDERDRMVLTLYYFEGMPLTEIAAMLGVTESRVSQLHMRALSGLRDRLEVA